MFRFRCQWIKNAGWALAFTPLLFLVVLVSDLHAVTSDTSWIDEDAVAIRLADRPRLFMDAQTIATIHSSAGDPFSKSLVESF
jgi:hypothetical protein